MKREELKAQGLNDDQINFVMAANGKDVNALNEKISSLTGERDGLQKQIDDRDSQLTDLKKSAKDNDDLMDQIKQLQDDNKAAAEKYHNDLAAQQKNFKIESALRDAKAKNVKAVLSLIDTDKISVAKDGSLSGLDEQIDAVKKSDDYLFEADKKPQQVRINPGFNDGGDGSDNLTSKIAARLANAEE
ncbi:phage scaffolding protein [Limosilactobacillus pontis]|uniref:phage scaffolding protein n=1 Tax=Limosilactobacillus pontis TaxID=35787 RepID=UPI00241C6298|nr:phage scaffolding protein [Limosilactobacillus pontis]